MASGLRIKPGDWHQILVVLIRTIQRNTSAFSQEVPLQ